MPSKPWTAAELTTLKTMWSAGVLVVDIAEALSRSVRSIEEKRKRACLPDRDRGDPWSAEDDELLREFWRFGDSVAEIAGALGRTPAAVLNRRFVLRLEPRIAVKPTLRAWSGDDNATLCRLWESGEPVNTIAARLRRTRGAVLARRIFLKLPRRGATSGPSGGHLDGRTG